MTSIKVKFRPSSTEDREGSIYYQLLHDRKVRRINTTIHIFSREWDNRYSKVTTDHDPGRRLRLTTIRNIINHDIERLTKIISRLKDTRIEYSADEIVAEYKRQAESYSLINYMLDRIRNLKLNGRFRTAEAYQATLNSFRKFMTDPEIAKTVIIDETLMLDSLEPETIEAYEAWLKRTGISKNTISFYNRILRALYRRAVEYQITEDRTPFRHVYTGIDKTVKRSLPIEIIKKIRKLDLRKTPAQDFARDIFIMSFMLRGMSFIDMAFLKKSDLKNGYVTYRRKKTGQLLSIEWTPEMQQILDKYPENGSQYLLPIIKKSGTSEIYVYRNVGFNVNRNLKAIAKKIGFTIPLTLYVARHSWASAAKAKGIPLSVISEGLGHDNEATTLIYLSTLDTTALDRANALLIHSL